MDKLIPSFQSSLFNDNSKSILADFTEIGIDSVLDDGLFKELPIVGTLMAVTKTAQRLHDRNLMKQTLIFIKTFNNKTINSNKLEHHISRIKSDKRYAEEELGRILLLLNSNIEDIKSEYFAKLYRAYILNEIDWDYFCEFSDVVSRLFIADTELLIKSHKNTLKDISNSQKYQLQRLQSLGLLLFDSKQTMRFNDDGKRTGKDVIVTSLGNKFCHIILNH